MPVAIDQNKPEARARIIDELGKLDAELAAMKPKKERADALKTQIQSWADAEFPATQAALYEGKKYAVQVSAKPNKQRIRSMELIFAFLGRLKFLSCCSFTLKAAADNLEPSQYNEAVALELNVGDRTVRPVRRALPVRQPRKKAA